MTNELPANQGAIACGWLHVAENRRAADERVIALFVVRVGNADAAFKTPILRLAGGPGDASTDELPDWLGAGWRKSHNLIFMDARGTGRSQPSLACKAPQAADELAALIDCRDRLLAGGINLSAYDAPAIARDIIDLLDALRLGRANLVASSYGARIAWLLAREYPERIRAMVLDGVYPPGVNAIADMSRNAPDALERLFADCAADDSCRRDYPGLRESFYAAARRLDASPAVVELSDTGESLRLTGDDFLLLLRELVAVAAALPLLPNLIQSVADGEPDLSHLAPLVSRAESADEPKSFSRGAYLSARCPDDLAWSQANGSLESASDSHIKFAAALEPALRQHTAACRLWSAPATSDGPASPSPLETPTLLLSGAYDPFTPPRYAHEAGKSLATGWRFVFPDAGHGLLPRDDCALELALAFFAEPQRPPQADCFAALSPPRFLSRGKTSD